MNAGPHRERKERDGERRVEHEVTNKQKYIYVRNENLN
jgi:hypothetical protein